MREIINIPRELMKLTAADWDVDWGNQSAGDDMAGGDQTVIARFPRFVGNPTVVMGQREHLAWLALRDQARGRVACYRVPMLDMFKTRLDAVEIPRTAGSLVVRPLANRMAGEARPQVPVVGAVAAGATSILVSEVGLPMSIPVGWLLSHDDWPFRVVWREPEGANVRLGVSMMRRAIPAGARIDLLATGLFLATSQEMGRAPRTTTGSTIVEMQFQEYITR